MKKYCPLSLSVLLFLSGCSSFMGGRFTPLFGGRFASNRDAVAMAPASGTTTTAVPSTAFVPPSHLGYEARGTSPAQDFDLSEQSGMTPGAAAAMPDAGSGTTPATEEATEKPKDGASADAPGESPPPRSPWWKSFGLPPATEVADNKPVGPALTEPAKTPVESAPALKPALTARPSANEPITPVHYVSSKRVRLEYEVRGAGTSGVSTVDLWYVREGHKWTRADLPLSQRSLYVDLGKEGRYGFRLMVRTAPGTGKKAPEDTETPQAWVEVDLTKPVVTVSGVKFDAGTQRMTVSWTATDRNLKPSSVCIYASTDEDGPWAPIAENVENTGHHDWEVKPEAGRKVYVRVEAADLAGNVGVAHTKDPVAAEVQPVALITKIEAAP